LRYDILRGYATYRNSVGFQSTRTRGAFKNVIRVARVF